MTDWLYDKIERVPSITDSEIAEMRHIEPLIASNGLYRRIDGIESVHPRDVSFLWSAKPIGEEFTFDSLNMTTIFTQHHSGVFFKPSLAEVYAWIRFFAKKDWQLFTFFCMGEARRIGASTDMICECKIMGGDMLVRGREVVFANGQIGHEMVKKEVGTDPQTREGKP